MSGETGEERRASDSNLVVLDGKTGEVDEQATLDEYKADRLRYEIRELIERMSEDFFVLSAKLYEVNDKMLYLRWGFKTFQEYVESDEVNFQLRKAQYFIKIWHWFGDLSDEARAKLREIGWSKLKELVGVVTEENVDEWVAKAMEMTVPQLALERKKHLALLDGEDGSGGGDVVKRVTFQLFDDQSDVVESALELAKAMSESDKKGNLISLICQDFCATNSSEAPSGASYLKRIEQFFGVKLVAINLDDKEVVFGQDTLETIKKLPEIPE